MSGDPLDGLPRPHGAAGALAAAGSQWTGGAEALGHTAQMLAQMSGRVLAQAWSGAAAIACAGQCARNAALVAMAADAFQVGGSALTRYAATLSDAQAQWDQARRLADQALADEAEHERRLTMSPDPLALVNPIDYFWTSPLRGQARAMAQTAIDTVRTAAQQAAGALTDTLRPFLPKPPPPEKHHWYTPVTDFAGGAFDAVKDPVVMVGGLVGLHGDVSDNWSDLGHGIAHGFTHPVDFGKALIDWKDLSEGSYSRWLGNLAPTAAAAFFTGGTSAATKGAEALDAVSVTGKSLEGLSEAEKAALLARGEELVEGSVGSEAAAKSLTAEGRLDYSAAFDDELRNFSEITTQGTVTLDHDLWLANVHDGSVPLNAGRSLKYSAPLDDVLANSRGGFVEKLALVPDWGPRTDVSIIHVPEGTSVTMAEGTTAAQPSYMKVLGQDVVRPLGAKGGGGVQVLLADVDRNWVVWTGKAPWPTTAQVAQQAAAGGLTVRTSDALADLAQPG